VEDKLAIHELIALYGHVIDERQFSRTAEIFSEDAIYDVTDFGKGVIIGHADIAQIWSDPASIHPLAHHATNVVINEDGSGEVRVVSKGLGLRPDGVVGSVTYRDVVKKGRGGWRITNRVAELRRPDRIPAIT
jgi:ketosteroid isomerase-like protein